VPRAARVRRGELVAPEPPRRVGEGAPRAREVRDGAPLQEPQGAARAGRRGADAVRGRRPRAARGDGRGREPQELGEGRR
jgi:hypothetical protein